MKTETMRVRMLKDWELEGTTYKKGKLFDVDLVTAEELFESGDAKRHSTIKSAVDGDGDADGSAPITKADLESAIKAHSKPADKVDVNDRPAGLADIEVKAPEFLKDPNKGFTSHRKFLDTILNASDKMGDGGVIDPRLRHLYTHRKDETIITKTVGSD
ncbi:hypothetical protein LCGC14_1917410, partial [marine sediment metagenome]